MSGTVRSLFLMTMLLGSTAAAQHERHGQGHGNMPPATSWKELNTVHNYLHLSHHAAMMDKDLTPTRNSARAMANAAEVWAKSTAPEACPPPADFTTKLEDFVGKTRSLAQLVEGQAADAELKTALDGVHDAFRDLHRVCPPGPKHQH
ncbi:MAG: hypothetical protein FJ206_16530 [Gemmatimonadetes bacterium]|nr:hypothetical protein [Gemmatimonadota bacterium]